MKWFRLYHSIMDSIHVRTLTDEAQLDYVLLLCCASEYRERTGENTGETGLTLDQAVFRTRRPTLEGTFTSLVEHRLCELDPLKKIVILGWEERQFLSDDTTARVKRTKEKQRFAKNKSVNVPSNVTETDTDTDVVVGVCVSSVDVEEAVGTTEERIHARDHASIARRVFDHWRSRLGHTTAKFTAERRNKVMARLREGYTEDQLLEAIEGCARSGFHRGDNDRGRPFDDLELICRTGTKVEHFIALRKQNSMAPNLSTAGRRTASSVAEWLEKSDGTNGP